MSEKPLLRVLAGESLSPPPIWLMRQAGRYLPEYQNVRAKAGSFLDLCYTPELAAEVTLQPIERFGFDAAIIFADILLIPHALGQELAFREKQGPQLRPVEDESAVAAMRETFQRSGAGGLLEHVYESLGRVKPRLAPETALIGFCGAPWTVATYMVQGHSKPDQTPARQIAYQAGWFADLIDLLVDVSADYLCGQIAAGADAVQIFDTWAGVLSTGEFDRWSIGPTRRLVNKVKARYRDVPIIGFPRGAGRQYETYGAATGVDCLGVDYMSDLKDVRKSVDGSRALQGNLDPIALLTGGEAQRTAVLAILEASAGHPHVFNLGHGIVPATPVEHVTRLIEQVRGRQGEAR